MWKTLTKTNEEADFSLYTVYDSKSRTYRMPSTSKNNEVLVRDLIAMLASPEQVENQMRSNPEDFSVFKVAEFDQKTGQLKSINLEHVVNLIDIKPQIESLAASKFETILKQMQLKQAAQQPVQQDGH